ncbi:DUF72 domain-containing protein [Tianweitania sp.]|uniref:DUF72 domain-containing protein n=1 Tax=Tianweitania sp. TaxID=2021634 RepID=UPI002898A5DC|nr:DUF72 domain-containing protein [Tianweitania sp.]
MIEEAAAPPILPTGEVAGQSSAPLRIGTAGWSVPNAVSDQFPSEGTHLQRYAARLGAAEINSSFYRPHRRATYERWAASVPEDFRFSVKLPKSISHAASNEDQEALIARFSEEVRGLGERLGVLLIQFPPRHAFDSVAANTLFDRLSTAVQCPIACEPRHASWFTPAATDLLVDHRIARVAADPAPVAQADEPGGWSGLRYYRLHGSPVIYRSSYDDQMLARMFDTLVEATTAGAETWCIFDNTASAAATSNALTLAGLAEQG